MKKLDEVIKPNATVRLKKCQEMISLMKESEYTKRIMDEWKLNIVSDPLKIKGEVLNPGFMLFGDQKQVNI